MIATGIYSYDIKSHFPDKIREWGYKKNIEIKSIEQRTWNIGPYSRWNTKYRSFYRVETSEGIYWFKFHDIRPEIDEVKKE